MSRVALLGWFGQRNLGDDLLFRASAAWIRSAVPGATIRVPIAYGTADQLPAVGSIEPIESNPRKRFGRLRSDHEALTGAGLLLFGGGGILSDSSPTRRISLLHKKGLTLRAAAKAVPIGFYSISTGPWYSSIWEALGHSILDDARAVYVRDAEDPPSGRLHSPRIIYGPDATIAEISRLSSELNPGPFPRGVLFAPAASGGDRGHSRQATAAGLSAGIQALLDSRLPLRARAITVFCACANRNHRDAVFLDWSAMAQEYALAYDIVEYNGDLAEAVRTIASSQLVIAQRLHVAITAAVLGVPVIPWAYHRKVANWASSVGIPPACCLPAAPCRQDWLRALSHLDGSVTDNVSATLKSQASMQPEVDRHFADLLF